MWLTGRTAFSSCPCADVGAGVDAGGAGAGGVGADGAGGGAVPANSCTLTGSCTPAGTRSSSPRR